MAVIAATTANQTEIHASLYTNRQTDTKRIKIHNRHFNDSFYSSKYYGNRQFFLLFFFSLLLSSACACTHVYFRRLFYRRYIHTHTAIAIFVIFVCTLIRNNNKKYQKKFTWIIKTNTLYHVHSDDAVVQNYYSCSWPMHTHTRTKILH